MLVLSRKPHEKVVLPTLETTIEILEIRGNVIRLGISAPSTVNILRGELADRNASASVALPQAAQNS